MERGRSGGIGRRGRGRRSIAREVGERAGREGEGGYRQDGSGMKGGERKRNRKGGDKGNGGPVGECRRAR